jgi:hypothetical protein
MLGSQPTAANDFCAAADLLFVIASLSDGRGSPQPDGVDIQPRIDSLANLIARRRHNFLGWH